jgi:diguanylate cyclase (GGDEF)-like protein/PAS domain S-box-containing protein
MTFSSVALGPVSAPAVLVVDDNAAKHLSIRAILEPLCHYVVGVDSGEAALRAVMERDFAVILMDVEMPLMDGYETARLIRLRRESERTPIIFITAHSRDEVQVPTAYASGAVDFMFAPLNGSIVRAKVSVFVELWKQSQDLQQSLLDVTKLSEQFRDNEEQTQAILDHVADGIVTVSGEGVIESFNPAASAIFGYSEQEAIGARFALMLAPSHRSFVNHAEAQRHLASERTRGGHADELEGCRKDGSTFPMELELSTVALGTRGIHIGCMRDISDRQAYTARLTHQALHDSLTGLPNRVLFRDRVETGIRAALRSVEALAILVLDLNGFKQINDLLGHAHGDCVLKLVAARLADALRDGDTVARLGGDEFGILPIGGTDVAGAATIAWKIEQALEVPFVIDGHRVEVGASIGIAVVPEHGATIDDLLRRADLAMYDAKRAGGGHAVFTAEQEEAPARRLALFKALRTCIDRDELILHFQPKIDLATRRTVGVEALIRWNHPSEGLVMPGDFMPEVERSDLMNPITEWVVGEALRRLREWRDLGYDLSMSVNMGARCLAPSAALFEKVQSLVKASGIPQEKLTLELTESALLDTAGPGVMEQFERMGERLSIDDFGTGYSSLVYLQRLPVMEIKADRSFVTHMVTAPDDAVIVRSTIDLAHNLSMKVVAEGVEDEPTMNQLISYGCDEAQGYFFSRPLPGDLLTEWFEASPFGVSRQAPQGHLSEVSPRPLPSPMV